MTGFLSRIFRVMTIDRKVFVEIYADPPATLQSFILVLITTIAAEVGSYGIHELYGIGIPRLLLFGTVGWIIEAAMAFVVGRFILPMPGTGLTPPSVARAITFTNAPLLFMIFGLIQTIPPFLWFILITWGLVITTVAMKQAFAWSFRRAIAGMIILQILTFPLSRGLENLLW